MDADAVTQADGLAGFEDRGFEARPGWVEDAAVAVAD